MDRLKVYYQIAGLYSGVISLAKLAGLNNWAWAWITAPLWVPPMLFGCWMALLLGFALFIAKTLEITEETDQ